MIAVMVYANETIDDKAFQNAVVGDKQEEVVTGCYGLGKINNRGPRLIDFCKEIDSHCKYRIQRSARRRYT